MPSLVYQIVESFSEFIGKMPGAEKLLDFGNGFRSRYPLPSKGKDTRIIRPLNPRGDYSHRSIPMLDQRPIDTSKESVHHKNGIRNDNRIENLELRERYHGAGHTIEERLNSDINFIETHINNLTETQKNKLKEMLLKI